MNQKKILIESLKEKKFPKEILNAFSKVKRENFIPLNSRKNAYEDTSLPIGEGQTISQPYTITVMLELLKLKKEQKVLEIGSGSGYVLALLSEIVGKKAIVFGVELVKELYEKSKENLRDYENIEVYNRDGNLGLNEKKPFDRILISARTEEIPPALVRQLKDKGIIVAPIGSSYIQSLTSFRKENGKLKVIEEIPGFLFVPLVS
tara:strand:- start:377 stop:991 length:615 start_codon:yes stop_codon:yes gene_type:complete